MTLTKFHEPSVVVIFHKIFQIACTLLDNGVVTLGYNSYQELPNVFLLIFILCYYCEMSADIETEWVTKGNHSDLAVLIFPSLRGFS